MHALWGCGWIVDRGEGGSVHALWGCGWIVDLGGGGLGARSLGLWEGNGPGASVGGAIIVYQVDPRAWQVV